MAGGIYGSDQVRKVNEAYPALVAHIRALFSGNHEPFGLMRIHFLTEFLDTEELARIFMGLSFLSPAEKRALVRAAILDVYMGTPIEFEQPVAKAPQFAPKSMTTTEMKPFTPQSFNLNPCGVESLSGQKAVDTSVAKSAVTPAHTSKTAKMAEEGTKQARAEQEKRTAAVNAVRSTPAKDLK